MLSLEAGEGVRLRILGLTPNQWVRFPCISDETTGEAFGSHGVRAGQQFILRTLWDEDGLTPGEIARRLGLPTPTVTKATALVESAVPTLPGVDKLAGGVFP
jgi:DNA-binding MarR family transcriptional regulator